jgi:PIN domain nuclease of toxin-antitoxin system
MNLLLDTHVFLWYLADSPRLSKRTRSAIARAGSVHVSVASLWEIAVKLSLGRLRAKRLDASRLATLASECGFLELQITATHAAGLLGLPSLHDDPFDRMLVAQAIAEDLTILTADATLQAYPARVEEA